MQYFQPILIVIGILAIAAVLIHGYLLHRKANPPAAKFFPDAGKKDLFAEKTASDSVDGIVGDVRIIRATQKNDNDFLPALGIEQADDIDFPSELSMQIFSRNGLQNDEDDFLQPLIVSELDHTSNGMAVDFSCAAELKYPEDEIEDKTEDIFIFNVVPRQEGSVVRGHELLQFLLTAGFRFGEMSIFHRHLHSDGTGPILFSVANMMAPGVFDPEKMEQFRSQGVSFFLTVPNKKINIKEAFDMMLVAVEQMTEEFDCLVLNAEREPLTEQQFRNYHERLLRHI